jgi:two-component sensor histidine kinase
MSIAEDDKGNLWFGTLGSGVCRFDGKNFTYYTIQQGLPDNNVWSVFCDSSKQLWFGTNKGLSLFIPQNDSPNSGYNIYNFGAQDGLKAIDFNLHSVCVDNDNRIWWGTGKNVASFDLNKKFHADSLRSLGISYVEINERFYDFRNLGDNSKNKITFSSVVPFHNYPDDLSLSYDQNHLTFHFAAIDWSAPHKIKYSYRLLGLDGRWSNPSTDAFADYRNLTYGNYELQVKAIGQSQIWTKPISYKFTIKPAWWQTWWFKTATVIIAVLSIVYVLWLMYLYRLRKQKILLEKKLAVQYERQRISADLHDDIGSTLSSINIYAGLAKKQIDNGLYLDSISQNINEVVGKLDDLVWSIKAGHDTLGNIADRLKIYAEPLTSSKQIAFNILMNDDLKPIKPPEGIKHHLFMTVKELINNAIKHADCKHIDIEFKKLKDILYVIVKDDGRGFNENTIRKDRNGLKNITQRVNEMEGKLDIQSSLTDGTIVNIQIPV